MICFASADHLIKLLTFEKLFNLIKPVLGVFAFMVLSVNFKKIMFNHEKLLFKVYIDFNII